MEESASGSEGAFVKWIPFFVMCGIILIVSTIIFIVKKCKKNRADTNLEPQWLPRERNGRIEIAAGVNRPITIIANGNFDQKRADALQRFLDNRFGEDAMSFSTNTDIDNFTKDNILDNDEFAYNAVRKLVATLNSEVPTIDKIVATQQYRRAVSMHYHFSIATFGPFL